MGEEQRITGGVSQTSHIMAQWWGLSYIHMDRAVRVSLQSSVAKRVPTKRVKIRKTVERADTRACAVGDRQASSSRQRGPAIAVPQRVASISGRRVRGRQRAYVLPIPVGQAKMSQVAGQRTQDPLVVVKIGAMPGKEAPRTMDVGRRVVARSAEQSVHVGLNDPGSLVTCRQSPQRSICAPELSEFSR